MPESSLEPSSPSLRPPLFRVSGGKIVKIDCYLSPECASEEGLRENIAQALTAERIEAELRIHRIDDNKAMALGVTGSPSVLIEGNELQPQEAAGFS
jgi:hypothetical protein